jgi:hypothetical protein
VSQHRGLRPGGYAWPAPQAGLWLLTRALAMHSALPLTTSAYSKAAASPPHYPPHCPLAPSPQLPQMLIQRLLFLMFATMAMHSLSKASADAAVRTQPAQHNAPGPASA